MYVVQLFLVYYRYTAVMWYHLYYTPVFIFVVYWRVGVHKLLTRYMTTYMHVCVPCVHYLYVPPGTTPSRHMNVHRHNPCLTFNNSQSTYVFISLPPVDCQVCPICVYFLNAGLNYFYLQISCHTPLACNEKV